MTAALAICQRIEQGFSEFLHTTFGVVQHESGGGVFFRASLCGFSGVHHDTDLPHQLGAIVIEIFHDFPGHLAGVNHSGLAIGDFSLC